MDVFVCMGIYVHVCLSGYVVCVSVCDVVTSVKVLMIILARSTYLATSIITPVYIKVLYNNFIQPCTALY